MWCDVMLYFFFYFCYIIAFFICVRNGTFEALNAPKLVFPSCGIGLETSRLRRVHFTTYKYNPIFERELNLEL